MYLGLDLGTSGVKALLMDEAQAVVASASADLEVSRPASGWSEQEPQHWLDATANALDELKRSHGALLAVVRGIGLSGQMHGATLLDADDKVLRPCILWNDVRSHKEAAELDENPAFRAQSGNIVFPGFTAPKLVWVKTHEPEIFSNVAKVLLPKDYLRLWLTGEHVSEMSDAAGTSWLDVGKRDWSDELLAATDLGREHMPRLVEGSHVSGTLRSELANRWGMGEVAVAGGAGDNAASAMGLGAIADGAAFVSLGTSGVLFASNASYSPKPESAVHAFCHAVPDTWHQMGVFLSATDSLNWWAGIAKRPVSELTQEIEGDEHAIDSAPLFLPYLSGERTPHNDARIRGAFVGLDHAHDQATMTRSVLEGVAFALRDSLEALASAGTSIERVMAVGGGTRSQAWLSIIADALNVPVDLPAEGDFGAAFGAARLGLLAAEDGDPVAVCQPPAIARSFLPDSTNNEITESRYRRYRALYPALSGDKT
ncbi:MAG: xylulokinase [Pseudomonadota bacterium]